MIPQEADQTHIEYGFPVVMPLCLSLIKHALVGGVDPGNFRNIFMVAK